MALDNGLMAGIGEEIAERLSRLGSSQTALARTIKKLTGANVARVTINRIINGETEGPNEATVTLIRRTLEHMERKEDIGEDDGLPAGYSHDPLLIPSHQRSSWIPTLGRTAAGTPTDFELNALGDRDLPGTLYHAPQETPAAIIADGDSMSPMIDHGDIVIIARRFWRAPQTGDVVAVSLVQERGHTIKILEILKDGRWQLKPKNTTKHESRTLEPADIKAAAVVVGWYHPLHRPRQKVR